MANTIQLKRSSTASDTPSASDLAVGELAVNTADAKLFTKHTDNSIKEITGSGGGTIASQDADSVNIDGGAIDGVTLGTNSAVTEAQIDSVHIDDYVIDGQSTSFGLVLKANGQFVARIQSTSQNAGGGLYLYQNNPYITFEGATADAYETNLKVTDPTADRDITLPDATGQVVLSDGAIDTEASAEIGRAHIGAMGHSDFAGFSHIDQNGTGSYALLQHSGGGTHLNAASGNSINFNINNANVMNMDAAGLYFYPGKVIIFEGSTDDTNETTLTVADPTADRTITLPDATGTVVVQDSSNDVTLSSSDAGADFDPQLIFDRDSSSPADFDNLGVVHFKGRNSADETITYSTISGMADDVTDGTEDGRIRFSTMSAGSTTAHTDITPGHLEFRNEQQIRWNAQNGSYASHLAGGTPTADRTITLPDATGTVQLTDGSGASLTSLNASELSSGTVPNARLDAQLQDVAGLAVTDGGFIVGDGSNFVLETGSTARSSLGLGTIATQAANNVDIDGGAIDGVTIGTNSAVTDLRVDNLKLNGNQLSSTNANGPIYITPAGAGIIQLQSHDIQIGDFNTDVTLTTYGTGDLTLNTNSGTNSGSIAIADGANGNISITPDGTGVVQIDGSNGVSIESGVIAVKNGGTQSEVRLYCESSNAHYAGLKAPAHADFSGNVTSTLPSVTGTLIGTANADAPATTTSSSDADHVLINDGGVLKKITPTNLGIGGGGSSLTIQDEGSALSTAATTLNFVGAGVAATGTGATKTITIGETSNADTVDNKHVSVLSQSAYDALTPDSNTLYFITG